MVKRLVAALAIMSSTLLVSLAPSVYAAPSHSVHTTSPHTMSHVTTTPTGTATATPATATPPHDSTKGTAGTPATIGVAFPIGNETSSGKPAVTYCNGHTYIAWAGTDSQHHLYIGWDPKQDGSGFTGKRQINDFLYSNSGPAITCFTDPSSGALVPFVAFSGTNTHIYVGWFDGTSTNLHNHADVGDKSYESPALLNYTLNLWLAFTGTNSYLYVECSFDGYAWPLAGNGCYRNQISWKASNGPALARYCGPDGLNLYLGWVDNTSSHNLHVGYYQFSSSLGRKADLPDRSHMNGDASLATSPYCSGTTGTLYFSYAGVNSDLNVAKSSNGLSWSTYTNRAWTFTFGLADVDINGHLWLVWANQPNNSPSTWFLWEAQYTP